MNTYFEDWHYWRSELRAAERDMILREWHIVPYRVAALNEHLSDCEYAASNSGTDLDEVSNPSATSTSASTL